MSLLHDDIIIAWWCHYCMMMSLLHGDVITAWWCHYCMVMSLLHDDILLHGDVIIACWCHYCMAMSLLHGDVIIAWWCHYRMVMSVQMSYVDLSTFVSSILSSDVSACLVNTLFSNSTLRLEVVMWAGSTSLSWSFRKPDRCTITLWSP